MEEQQQRTFTQEVRFGGGQAITVTVCLCGKEKKDYGKMIPIVKVLFDEVMDDLGALS